MWQPSNVAFGVLAGVAGGCAAWSWYHGEVGAGVGAFVIGFLFGVFARSVEVEKSRREAEP